MEVHPPDHAIHSRRDFVIHMSTIVLGLLIAIGLEQTVEYVHHRHEVRELEHSAIEDDRTILQVSSHEEQHASRELALLSQRAADVRTLMYRPDARSRFPRILSNAFNNAGDAAWKTAKTNGVAALVPAGENEILTNLDVDCDALIRDLVLQWDACTRRIAFEKEFAVPNAPDEMDLSRAGAADLSTYLDLLREERAADVRVHAGYAQLRGMTTTILEGEKNPQKVLAGEDRFISTRNFMEQ